MAFLGDGATNIGAFHESVNLAAIWRLPVLFVIENNQYGEYSPLASTTPITRLADRAASYGIPGVFVDGNDVCLFYDMVTKSPAGTAFIAEWLQVKGDRIASIRVVFDARAFAAMFAKK